MPATLTATGNNPSFRRGLAAVDLFGGVVAAIDGDNIDLITLNVTNLTDPNPANEWLIVDGKQVELTNGNSEISGSGYTVAVSRSGTTATVTITPPAGGITANQLQGLIETLAYQIHPINAAPATLARQVTITSISDTGGDDTPLLISSTATPVAINELVSADNAGAQGNSGSFLTQVTGETNDASLSNDGRYVAFYSTATNLVTGDTNTQQDVFVRDRTTDTTIRVSIADDDVTQANGASDQATISADGKRVAFSSLAFNLVSGEVNDGARDIYVRDIAAQTTTKVSVSTAGGDGNGVSDQAEISQNGNFVVFRGSNLTTNLVDAASVGGVDNNNQSDIFVRNLTANTTVRASLADNEAQGDGASSEGTISADGNLVAFSSLATNLIGAGVDTNAQQDIFLRNISTGTTTRISVSTGGAQATGGASSQASMSNDGNIIAFVSTATNLGGDDNGTVADIFIRNVSAGTTTRINAGDGATNNFISSAPSVSADGTRVAFQWSGATFVYNVATGQITSASRSSSNVGGFNGIGGAISGDGTTVVFESQNTGHVDGHTGSFADVFATTVDFNRAPTISEADDNSFGNEDSSFFLRRSTAPNNQIFTVNDLDTGQTLTVQVWVEQGTLAISGSNGGATVSGAGAALNLTGTVAQINTALNNLQYTPPANFSGTVQVTITATDNGAIPASFTENGNPRLLHFIAVAAVNDVPTLAGLDTPFSFTQSTTPVVIDNDVVFGDVEGNFNGGRLTVTGLLAEDQIGVNDQGPGANQIDVQGNSLFYNNGGSAFGTFSGGTGNTFTVTFNANATAMAIDALIQNLTYANADTTPTASRTLLLNVTDNAAGGLGYSGPEVFAADAVLTGVPTPILTGASPTFVNLDGDGIRDLVIGTGTGARAFKNNGDRTFTEFATNPLAAVNQSGAKLAFADLDNDSDLDALVGNSGGTLGYYRNDGASFSSQGTPAPFTADFGDNAAPLFADVDGDGDLDLLVGSSVYAGLGNAGEIAYFRNTAGTFSQQTGTNNPFDSVSIYGASAANPALVDLDGDGDLDLLVGVTNPYGTEGPFGEIRAYRNPGSGGQFTLISGSDNPFNGLTFATDPHPAVGDIDADGDLDIVIGFDDGSHAVYENNTPTRGQALVINVAAANAAPTLDLDTDNDSGATGSDFATAFTEGGSPVLIADDDVSIADADAGEMIEGATVAIQSPVAGDALVLGPQGGFTVTGSGTGTITITGTGTAAQYEAMLELITFSTSSDNPGPSRTIHTTVTDGTTASSIAVTTITITQVNDAPSILALNGDVRTFTEGGPVIALDAGTGATVSDIDSTDFDTGNLTVSITANEGADDVLGINTGGGDVSLSAGMTVGSTVSVSGTAIGTITSPGTNGDDLVVTFNANANATNVTTLIGRLTYENTSQNPSTAARTVGVTVSDGDGGTSAAANVTVNVVAANDAPTLQLSNNGPSATLNYTENDAASVIAPTAVLADDDSPDFNSGSLTVSFFANGAAEDLLGIRNQGTGAGQIGVSGTDVTFGGTTIGTISGAGTNASPLVITFNASASRAAVEALIQNVTYFNTSDAPSTASRTVQFTVVDGDGSPDTAVANAAVNLTAVNDAPAGADTAKTILEGGTYTFATADFGFSDAADAGANALLAVKISTLPGAGTLTNNGAAVNAGDSVSATDIGSGLLVFTPAANGNGAPYATFTFQVQDNGGTTNGGVDLDPTANSFAINVTGINDEPAGTDKTVAAVEDTAYAFTAADFGFSDPLDGNALLAVRIATLPGAGTLTNNGVAVNAGDFVSAADITGGKLRFTPALNASGAAYASFTFQVQDDGGTANGGVDLDQTANTITVDVNAANDAPHAIAGGPFSVNENSVVGAIVGTVIGADVDNATLAYSLTDNAGGRFAIDGVTGQITVLNGVLLDYEQNGAQSITVRATDSGALFFDRTFSVLVNDVNPEFAHGSAQGDVMVGGALSDRFSSNGGNDTVIGGGGNDTLLAGDGTDYVAGGAGNDHIVGGAGFQSLNGDDGNDYMDGGGDADGFFGGVGNDTMVGGSGADYMVGGADDDQLFGLGGDDTLVGDDGNDLLVAGSGANFLFGGAGQDTLHGGENSDYMVGGSENDQIFGGLGDDQLFGGAGTDLMVGGDGQDHFIFLVGDGQDTIADFDAANDVINLGAIAGVDTLQDVLNRSTQQGADTVIDLGGGDVLVLSNVQRASLQGNDFYL